MHSFVQAQGIVDQSVGYIIAVSQVTPLGKVSRQAHVPCCLLMPVAEDNSCRLGGGLP
jgi:hypothetical protein